MSKGLLTPEDRHYFRQMMRRQINSAVHRRMNTLLLLDDGWSVSRVAAALFLDEKTVRMHEALYRSDGRDGVERLAYVGSSPHLTEPQLQALKSELKATLYMNAKAVAAWIRKEFSVEYTPNATAKLLKRLGFVYKLPKRVPAKASEDVQRTFVEQTLQPLLDKASEATPVYFVDATHAAYDAHAACGWIPRGETRELKANHGRVRVNINGALNAVTQEVIYRQDQKITATAMISLFSAVEEAHPEASEITVILDNATYNRAKDLRQ
jgi:transposase